MSGFLDDTSMILRRFSIRADSKLGDGDEADVYVLGQDRVIKLFKSEVDPVTLDRRRDFYTSLDMSAVPFAVPQIIERGEEGGRHYTIEARIPGTSLMEALPRLDGARRHEAFLAYADAAAKIGEIGCPRQGYGEILAVPPLVADSWSGFVLARAKVDLDRSRERVMSAIDVPDRAIGRLERLLFECSEIEPGLVHGDYYPANVLIDERGRVTGVIDFSGLTLFGDPRLDLAASLLHLTGIDGITASDRKIVFERLRRRGLGEVHLALYRLYYAFCFLDTTREGLFRWCLDTIRAAC